MPSSEFVAVTAARTQKAVDLSAVDRVTDGGAEPSWTTWTGGSPSGSCPMSAGRFTYPNQLTGTAVRAMTAEAANQAIRHPHASIATASRIGTMDMPPMVSVILRPSAKPRRRSNQCMTATVEVRLRAPWPRSRMPKNPAASHTTPRTIDMCARARAKAIPKAVDARRTPTWSTQRPILGWSVEDSRVPTR